MRVLPVALTAIAVIWVVAILAAPSALAHGRWPVATFLVYEAGSHICHQRRERSFEWSGVQMPVCGRCLGLGACAGVVGGAGGRRTIAGSKVLALAAAPILLSLGLELVNVVQGSNVTRFVSGLPFGAVAAWTLVGVAKPRLRG
jgi:uncharacterized membrane protein